MNFKFTLIIAAFIISQVGYSQNEISQGYWNEAVKFNENAVYYYNDYGQDRTSCEKLDPLHKACEFYEKTLTYLSIAIAYEEDSSSNPDRAFIRKCESSINTLMNERKNAVDQYFELEMLCESPTENVLIYGKPQLKPKPKTPKTTITKPEQIGPQVFEILKNLNNSTKESFVSNFLTIEELWEIGEQMTANGQQLTSLPKDTWVTLVESLYEKIERQGNNWSINWPNIEYSDFEYKVVEDDGVQGYEGTLYFKFKEQSFKIEIASILHNEKYGLFNIKPVTSISE